MLWLCVMGVLLGIRYLIKLCYTLLASVVDILNMVVIENLKNIKQGS